MQQKKKKKKKKEKKNKTKKNHERQTIRCVLCLVTIFIFKLVYSSTLF